VIPKRVPIKGPQGKDMAGNSNQMPEPQERYKEEGGRPDVVDGNFVQDPFELKAHFEDHTPNFTKAPKGEKIGWNFQKGRGSGGVGL
jgi:hypothetical protein